MCPKYGGTIRGASDMCPKYGGTMEAGQKKKSVCVDVELLLGHHEDEGKS